MKDLKVDYDRLTEIASELDKITCRLRAVDQKSDFTEVDFGDGDLLKAVRRFSDGWKDGRTEINDGIEAMTGHLSAAAEAYREFDQALRQDGVPQRTTMQQKGVQHVSQR